MSSSASRAANLAGLLLLAACSASATDTTSAKAPASSLGLAIQPGPCVVGANVVFASAFVSDAGAGFRHLLPTDGDLKVRLVLSGQQLRPVALRWLAVPASPAQPLPGPPWNLELSFESATAGACPLRVEFKPTPQLAATGLGSALTTIVLQDAPPPPPP